mmetsp:Transcript_47093/g.73688  ORF Transcript_47093/g.73688 Transcript_47093/m.73688 type:complete len:169 (-) Transcript_47093:114-620(-)|eukprot:CAMPEP_0184299218 /NCGR_PEP_ID=MMETSP1049-20130417/9868_1 /TAXON_ID=77928 /ORGANISM="Proteomonas sulcata, Strain CCMP704" /LENGTH=168 /DNA_ID=CAMNT_0026609585 /DNA_START=156 /DNA_END=662 /DNA_ORIENTATION=+
MPKSSGGTVFVTVGTTKFVDLVKAFDGAEVQDAISKRGFSKLKVQYGKSGIVPGRRCEGLEVESYDFKPSLKEDMDDAQLIICHAGAGSIMESLRLGKKTIVVANETLMDNHQMELAAAMKDQGLVATATTKDLRKVLLNEEDLGLKRIPALDLGKFKSSVLELMQEP